jgi:pimeloyl-ACP methyl ester carboxylesterase
LKVKVIKILCPYTTNPFDGIRIYFEDDGGKGDAALFYGGILDSVDLVRVSDLATGLKESADEFRLIFADHRGLGRSDKPHSIEAYAIQLRVADVTAVLDKIGIQRAHFIGTSYGGKLGFGLGEHAATRVLSLVISGQQPYAINPDGPLARVVIEGIKAARIEGIKAFVEALESYSGISESSHSPMTYDSTIHSRMNGS